MQQRKQDSAFESTIVCRNETESQSETDISGRIHGTKSKKRLRKQIPQGFWRCDKPCLPHYSNTITEYCRMHPHHLYHCCRININQYLKAHTVPVPDTPYKHDTKIIRWAADETSVH